MTSCGGGEDGRTAGVSEAWDGFQTTKGLLIKETGDEEFERVGKVRQYEGRTVVPGEGAGRATEGSGLGKIPVVDGVRPEMDAGRQKGDE